MALTEEMLGICLQTKPNFCCIVPERREELTTEGGLDISGMTESKFNFLKEAIDAMYKNNIVPSLFIAIRLFTVNSYAGLEVPMTTLPDPITTNFVVVDPPAVV